MERLNAARIGLVYDAGLIRPIAQLAEVNKPKLKKLLSIGRGSPYLPTQPHP